MYIYLKYIHNIYIYLNEAIYTLSKFKKIIANGLNGYMERASESRSWYI